MIQVIRDKLRYVTGPQEKGTATSVATDSELLIYNTNEEVWLCCQKVAVPIEAMVT